MNNDNIIVVKSKAFALRIVKLYKYLKDNNIALKEASEREYWLELLYESGYITKEAFDSIYADCQEI